MICSKCGKEVSDIETVYCPKCGSLMNEFNEKSQVNTVNENRSHRNGNKAFKIFLICFLCIFLVLAITAGIIAIIHNTPNYKLKNSYYFDAIDIYYESFQGGKKERHAIDYIVNSIENTQDGHVALATYPEFYRVLGPDNWNFEITNEFETLKKFIDEANEKYPSPDTEKWEDYLNNIYRISKIATPLKEIYADPSSFYGKTVIVGGIGDSSNDIKRKMWKIGVRQGDYGLRMSSDSYPLELYYGDIKDGKWLKIAGSNTEIIAYGTLKKYNNSDDVYLDVNKMDFIYEADLEKYSVTPSNEQTGQEVVSREQLRVFVEGIIDNVQKMKSFTDYIIEEWSSAVSSNKNIDSAISKAYEEKNSDLSVITWTYTAHIFEFSEMNNVPETLQPAFDEVKLLFNLYADFYKGKIENPSGSLITYTRDVGSALEEINSCYNRAKTLIN